MVSGSDHGHFAAHFHSTTVIDLGLLQYATLTNDSPVKLFVRQFYEYARNFGLARIGFFPANAGDHGSYRSPDGSYLPQPAEGCCIAEMMRIAIGLCDAGMGDYWDDVDQCLRSRFIELQLIDRALLDEVSRAGRPFTTKPGMTADKVTDRCIGTFSAGSDPTALYPLWTLCCVGNCSVALYRAWESVVRPGWRR